MVPHGAPSCNSVCHKGRSPPSSLSDTSGAHCALGGGPPGKSPGSVAKSEARLVRFAPRWTTRTGSGGSSHCAGTALALNWGCYRSETLRVLVLGWYQTGTELALNRCYTGSAWVLLW